MANTSMTPRDVGEMSYPELEGLIEGLNKNAQKEREELENGGKPKGDENSLLEFITAHDGGF